MKRLVSWIPWFARGAQARPSRCRRHRPMVEEFEDRNLLSGANFLSADFPTYLRPFDWTLSTITVSESFLIQDLNVTMDVDQAADSSLVAYLQRPDQSFIYLFGFVAASGADFHGTTLDDEAATPIALGTATFTGSFQPFEQLAAVDATSAAGTWTLWLYNYGASFGLLSQWSMEIAPVQPVAEMEPNEAQNQATHVPVVGETFAQLEEGDVDYYTFTIAEPGEFQVEATGLDTRLTLLAPDSYVQANGLTIGGGGTLLVSEDRSANDANPLIRYSLVPGRYFVAVSSTSGQTGPYTLSTRFASAPNPYQLTDTGVFVGNVGDQPVALVMDDFNRDGFLDLASANQGASGLGNVAVLLGKGDGTFQAQSIFTLSDSTGAAALNPIDVASGDFNSDGRPDLAVSLVDGSVRYLPGVGDGSFLALTDAAMLAADFFGVTRVEGDFNRDGTLDDAELSTVPLDRRLLVFMRIPRITGATVDAGKVTNYYFGGPLADIDYLFEAYGLDASVNPSIPSRATPQFADLNGDAFRDLLLVSGSGDILVRYGRKGGVFDAPEPINADRDFDRRARAVVVLAEGRRAELAAIDVGSNTISFYARDQSGWSRERRELATGILPVRLISADLDGDGRKDLVTGNQVLGTLSLFLAKADGSFERQADVKAGVTIADLAAADVNGDGATDLLLANPASGEVGVLVNQGLPTGSVGFAPFVPYRAGAGTYGAVESGASAVANQMLHLYDAIILAIVGFNPTLEFDPIHFGYSPIQTGNLVVGDFNEDQILDVIATNREDNSFAVLLGKGRGALIDPHLVETGANPSVVRAADFNGDGHLDLAILEEGTSTVSIFIGDGAGNFTATFTASAGNAPTGLSVEDVDGDGIRDLALGNVFGDVLVLLGNGRRGTGDGTFRAYQRTERNIALAVSDLDGDGRPDFVFANQARDRVAVRFGGSTAEPDALPDPGRGVLGPGALGLADLDGDGIDDLVVANSGSNNILVYLGLGRGEFAEARSFFAGTNPAGVTIADINGDARADVVVANRGSNDVSLLLGSGSGSQWDLQYGPRLQAGSAPVSTAVTDVTGLGGVPDGKADLLITNSGSNDVFLLPGRGDGFFADQNLRIFDTGPSPTQSLVGDFTGDGALDLVVLNGGASTLSFFAGFNFAQTIGSGGVGPSDALAGDFNLDGLADLLVANNGDGHVALFLGAADGLGRLETLAADVFHPTALALANLRGTTLEVFVAAAGEESISTLTFRLPGNESRAPIALIQPLGQTSLALVATLIIGGRSQEDVSADVALAEDAIGLAAIAIAMTTFEERETAYAAASSRIVSSTERGDIDFFNFLSGVDEALEVEQEGIRTPENVDSIPTSPRGPAPVDDAIPETNPPASAPPKDREDDQAETLQQESAGRVSESTLEAPAACFMEFLPLYVAAASALPVATTFRHGRKSPLIPAFSPRQGW